LVALVGTSFGDPYDDDEITFSSVHMHVGPYLVVSNGIIDGRTAGVTFLLRNLNFISLLLTIDRLTETLPNVDLLATKHQRWLWQVVGKNRKLSGSFTI
jgi:hypothetical protein